MVNILTGDTVLFLAPWNLKLSMHERGFNLYRNLFCGYENSMKVIVTASIVAVVFICESV